MARVTDLHLRSLVTRTVLPIITLLLGYLFGKEVVSSVNSTAPPGFNR